MTFLGQLLNIPTLDPEGARKQRLLNVLLLGTFGGTILLLLWTIAYTLLGWAQTEADIWQPLLGTFGMLLGIVIIFTLNRHGYSRLAAWLFLIVVTLVGAFTDPNIAAVVNGHSSAVFVIPIIMASVILPPHSSFLVAGVVSLFIAGLSASLGLVPNVFLMVIFFVTALVSWLSARSLERALDELRAINRELDQRVEERTRDLANALTREHAESSKGQAILEGIADGVIVFDTHGRAMVANPAIGRILERPSEGIVGCDIETLMHKNVAAEDQEMVVGLLSEKELRRSSLKFEWDEKMLSVSFAPVRDVAGTVTGTVAVFRDYTREAEIDRMKSDFVSIVSHELRTPLTSIKGYLDLVLMGAAGVVNKQQTSFLEIAKGNTDRLNEMVAELLDISRIESGKVELDVQVVSISELIERAAHSLRREFEDRGLTLTLALAPDLPEIFGDPGRISQVLMNLLSNAYKYTPRGGATVRARLVRNSVQIDVTDTGVGISPGDREKLFTRFFRAEDAAVRQQPGTGLGLNITKSIVEMHGGGIWVESEPGAGTTFSFTLPVPAGLVPVAPAPGAKAARRTGQPARPVEPPSALPAGPQILVVDDDIDVAHLFEHQLAKAGYEVTVVTQGGRVLEVARQLQPDLLTLDLMMDVDGLQILRELKADPETARIPVVIISVITEPEKGLALGAADYLVKPLDEGELLNRVRRVLDQLDGDAQNKILVVDDEVDVVGWLKHFLTHSGFEVTEAYDGMQALEAVDADRPDLILLDLKMPRMDGRTAIRRLREKPETRDIPIIVLSANPISDEIERVEMLGLGVKEFLRKPVTVEALVAEIEKYLGDDST
jgi:PAS domain S-box-containing protein